MDPTNANTALASAMVEELARCGARRAVLSPGSRSAPLALALWRQPEIDVTVMLDERSAGYFAIGAAQAGATPVVVLCTSGTAAANLHPAVAEADEAAVPLIVLTADRPPELRGIGAGQTIDQLKLYGSAVRWFCEVGTHAADDSGLLHYRSTACRAFAAARGEPRPGPVHLNVAWREPLAPSDAGDGVSATSELALRGRGGERPLTTVVPVAAEPSDQLLGALAERVHAHPRGVIVAGRQTDPALGEALASLARVSGYPILAEPTSQVRMGPHDRSAVIWAYDSIARATPEELAPDVVLRFGEMPTSKPLREWLISKAPIQLVIALHGWNEPGRIAGAMVRADATKVAAGLAERLAEGFNPDGDWLRTWLDCGQRAADAIEAALVASGVSEPAIHAELGRTYRSGELVYTASSMPIRDQEAFVAAGTADVVFLCNRGANGLDGLISSGAGAAVASGRPTWIVTGDLGLVHDAAGLAGVAACSTPIRVVVINNGGGGIFEFLPQAELVARDEFEALFGTPAALDIAALTAANGLEYRRAESLADLTAPAEGSCVIEIRTDRSANVAVHREIAEKVAQAIS